MTFTDRNLPARVPAGPAIPHGIRTTILGILAEAGATPTLVWSLLQRRQGYGNAEEVREDIEERFSREQADEFATVMRAAIETERHRTWAQPGVNYLAEPTLLVLPEALFLDAVELTLKTIGSYAGTNPRVAEINGLFARRGIYFKFDEWSRAVWVGDPGAYTTVIEPVLVALADLRLSGSRDEFEAALRHLRQGTAKDHEDAIEEAGKAVESAMKVLLDEHTVPLTGKETATPLFDKLRDNGVVEAEADSTVLGAARIRNRWGGHGAGAVPRNPPADLAELAVRAAAIAIVFLAGRLP